PYPPSLHDALPISPGPRGHSVAVERCSSSSAARTPCSRARSRISTPVEEGFGDVPKSGDALTGSPPRKHWTRVSPFWQGTGNPATVRNRPGPLGDRLLGWRV